jgi:hypothetical protein
VCRSCAESTIGAGVPPTLTVSVYELEADGTVRHARSLLRSYRLLADRFVDHLEPSLPLFGSLWFEVSE